MAQRAHDPCSLRGSAVPRTAPASAGATWRSAFFGRGVRGSAGIRPPLSQPGGSMRLLTIARSLALVVLTVGLSAAPAKAAHGKLHSLSPHLRDAVDLGRAPASERHRVVVSRSEEHTSELQSQSNLVCRLLLEKKK